MILISSMATAENQFVSLETDSSSISSEGQPTAAPSSVLGFTGNNGS